MGALLIARREEEADREVNVTERLRELEHQSAVDRSRVERLSELSAAADRDLRNRLQAALVARDERIEAMQGHLHRAHRATENPASIPQYRLQEQLDTTAGKLETVHSSMGLLEERIQAKLTSFREATQEVLRKLAEHQVEEAERVTGLTRAVGGLQQRLEVVSASNGDDRPTTAALVEVLETQVVLTERAGELESRVEQGLEQLEHHRNDVETRLLAIDEMYERLSTNPVSAAVDQRIVELEATIVALEQRLAQQQQAAQAQHQVALERNAALEQRLAAHASQPARTKSAKRKPAKRGLDRLDQLYGLGPKLAEQLSQHGIPDISALAALTDQDLERLSQDIRGLKDRAQRHDWRGQAAAIIAEFGSADTNADDAAVIRQADGDHQEAVDNVTVAPEPVVPATNGALSSDRGVDGRADDTAEQRGHAETEDPHTEAADREHPDADATAAAGHGERKGAPQLADSNETLVSDHNTDEDGLSAPEEVAADHSSLAPIPAVPSPASAAWVPMHAADSDPIR